MKIKTKIALLIAFAILITATAYGQEFRATISGLVTDSTGSAVPGATVEVRNVGTNVAVTVKTQPTGDYTVPFLVPGTYTVTIEAAGFKKFVQSGIVLEVAQKAGVSAALQVGAQTESVTVAADAAMLDTESANQGGTIDPQKVAELPMNSRNPYVLTMMMPGVEFRGNLSWLRPFDGSTFVQWDFNGGAQGFNEVLIDGAPNDTLAGGGYGVGYVPIVDAVMEMRVMSSPYDAQFGRTAGGVSNTITKSGANTVHGSLYEFMRRQALDTNTFQNNAIGAAKPQHFLDQYGFELDGPVFIPKVYNGKNKMFFTVAFERYREASPNPLFDSVPEPEFFNGDFSKLTNSAGLPITIYDPNTGVANSSASSGWQRTPFPGNQIPLARISPIATKILSYTLKPNCTTPGQGYSIDDLCLNIADVDHFHNMLYKWDYNINEKNHIFLRYGGFNRQEHRPYNGLTASPGVDGQEPYYRISNSAVADWVATVSPTLIANVHGSYTRFIEWGYGIANQDFDLTSLGFPGSLVNGLPNAKDFGIYAFDNYNPLGRSQVLNLDNDFALNGNITKIYHKHSIHAGIDVRQHNYEIQNTGNIFYFDSHNDMTQKTYNVSDSTSGNSMASFLLGQPTSGSGINIPLFSWWKQWYEAVFVQDDWKASSRLTLNLGFRWDIYPPTREKWNRQNGPFSTTVASPLASQINGANYPAFPTLTNISGGPTFVGVSGADGASSLYKTDWHDLQARIGGAYRINDKLVARAGYGMYYFNVNNDWNRTTGFSSSSPLNYSNTNGELPIITAPGGILSNPYPTGYLTPTGSSLGPLTYAGQGFSAFNPNFTPPRTDQFSAGLQAHVSASSMVEVSYDGSRGYGLQMTGIPYNEPSLANRKTCNIMEGGSPNYCNTLVPNPFQGNAAFNGTSFYTASTITRYQLLNPFPQFGAISQLGNNGGHTWYNSAQFRYTFKARNGLNLNASYVLSKWMQRSGYTDPFAGVFNQSPAPGDQTHVVKITGVYQLPFGKGKHFLAGAGGVANRVIGGWEFTSNYQIRSGEPANLPGNVLMLQNPAAHSVNWDQYQPRIWSNCVEVMDNNGNITPEPYSVQAGCTSSQYAWLILPTYSPNVNPSTSGQMRMSRETFMDSSLNKNIQITERVRFEFRAEAFNFLNHFSYGTTNINTTATSAQFGTFTPSTLSTTTSVYPRQIQLGFKLLW